MPLPDLSTDGCQKRVSSFEPASVEPPGVEKSRHEEPRSETVTERRARQSEENESSDASDLASPDGAAVAAALVARRRAGPERARALEVAAAERGRQRRDDDTDTALDKDTSREMDADAPLHESGATLGRGTSAAANEKKVSRADEARRGASAFLVSITKKHASSPPSSLPGMEIFCVTSTTRLRYVLYLPVFRLPVFPNKTDTFIILQSGLRCKRHRG